jgi:hypothetical protein
MAIPEPAIVQGDLPTSKARGAQVPKVNVTSMKARGVVTQPEDRHRVKVADQPFLMEHTILKVTNVDNVDWEFKWDRTNYLVRKGQTGFVPFPAVVLKMGDPRSMPDIVTRFNSEDGQRGIIPTRYDSLCTLFAHYGIANEDVGELVDYAPKLEVRTMAEDIVIQFPVQNPDMVAWPVPQVPEPGRENSDARRLMDKLGEENRAMRDELAEMRSLISGKLNPPVGQPDPRITEQGDDPDALAAALAGATVDQGPSTQLR